MLAAAFARERLGGAKRNHLVQQRSLLVILTVAHVYLVDQLT
jgi:hypothetical protein